MKKVLILLAVVIVAIFAFLILRDKEDEITNIGGEGVSVVAFGDSLVYGVGSGGEGGFVSILSERIGRTIVNKGVSGNTTADGLKRVDEVLALEPEVVILLLGGNDAIRKISTEKTFENLSLLIESIHESGSAVLLVGIQSGILRDKYKDEFKKLSREYKTAYVPDILDGILGTKFMSDPIHPNNEGYALMADKIEPVLIELLDS